MTDRKDDCLTGAKEIAEFLGVSRVALWRMRKEHKEMPCKVLRPGGLSADKRRLRRWRNKKISK